MDGHGILHPVGLLPPHGAVDPLGGKDGARVLQEQPQDLILPGGEGDRFPIQGDGLGAVVQGDAPGLEEGGFTTPPPSWRYRRSWDFTRASTSTGLKGLVT